MPSPFRKLIGPSKAGKTTKSDAKETKSKVKPVKSDAKENKSKVKPVKSDAKENKSKGKPAAASVRKSIANPNGPAQPALESSKSAKKSATKTKPTNTASVLSNAKPQEKKTFRGSSSIFDDFGSDDGNYDSDMENIVIETPLELPELSTEEEDLFDAVEAAQLVEVKQILTKMNVATVSELSSKWNDEGDTIFHVAIRRQDEEILDFMLDFVPNLDNIYYDILLLAVKESSVEIAQRILEAIRKKPGFGPTEPGKLGSLPRWKNSEFDDHMTPIMLACIVGNYDLIALFAVHGERLEPELTYKSPTGGRKLVPQVATPKSNVIDKLLCCFSLKQHPPEDIIDDYQRLHEYQALTSPEMLCFMANSIPHFDPLSKAFDYIEELTEVLERDNGFRDSYSEMIEKLSDFTVQLVSMCDSSRELDLLLSRRDGYHGSHDKYPRVVMAMEMGLRDFVAHPHTQGILYTQWAGQHWNEWRYFSSTEKIWEFTRRVIFFPMFLLFVFGEQGNRHGRLLSCPLNRCFYSCISQMIFISLAVTEHLLEAGQPNERMPPNIYIEILLALFVFGQIRALTTQFFHAPRTFFKTMWNWYDIITCLFFCGCFTCWGFLYIVYRNDTTFMFRKREPLERQYWKFYDPLMIADACLAVGTIMACGKLLRYVQLHSTIGPIQIALGKMIMNILNFVLFFIVVMSSFMLGITVIYAPYRGVENTMTGEKQSDVFSTHKNTLTEMYWDLFGMAAAASSELVTLVVQDDSEEEGHAEEYEHLITEIAGKTLYSIYSFFGATILFSSLLVAYISNTFGQIVEENEINWKFNRAQLWIYFARSSVMPPPFNLFPTLWDVISIFRTMRDVKRNPKKYFATCNCAVCFHSENIYTPDEKATQDRTYFNLVKLLIQRYFRSKTALEARALPSAELVSSLREEMDELKTLIDEAVRKIRPNGTGGGDGNAGNTSRLSLPAPESQTKPSSPRKSAPTFPTYSFPAESSPKNIKSATTGGNANRSLISEVKAPSKPPVVTKATGSTSKPDESKLKKHPSSIEKSIESVFRDIKTPSIKSTATYGRVSSQKRPAEAKESPSAPKMDSTSRLEQKATTESKEVKEIYPPLPPLPPSSKNSEVQVTPTKK